MSNSTVVLTKLNDAVSRFQAFGGLGGVSFMAQVAGTLAGIAIAVIGALIVYGTLKALVGLRLEPEQEFMGADLSIHKISATADNDGGW